MEDVLSECFGKILESVGEDVTREGLLDTPGRAARAMAFLTQGYTMDLDEVVNGAIFESDVEHMIIVKDIELYSMCEHHMLPFVGKAHVAYIPQGKVLGLSKVARIIDVFARRFQIQERLTQQIADAVMTVTGARGVAVTLEARHLCMMMRGVQKQNSTMTTSVMLGDFRDEPECRAEYLQLLRH